MPQNYSCKCLARLGSPVCGNHVNVLPPLNYVLLSWDSVRLPESAKDKLTPRRWECTVPLAP